MAGHDRFPRDRFVTIHESRSDPEISVLMPLFEQEPFVSEAVASVLAQERVTCEVIVSDDASSDATFARALQTSQSIIESRTVPHRIVMRRGIDRLRRDHPPLLEEAASCDVVAHAHGDDVSRPDRARSLLDALESTGAALAFSAIDIVDERGRHVRQRGNLPSPRTVLTAEEILSEWGWPILACEAWRRTPMAVFGRLDSSVAPEAHDQILPFRAALIGGVVGIAEPLVAYRDHATNWNKSLADERTVAGFRVSLALTQLVCFDVMIRDLERARTTALIDEATYSSLRAVLGTVRAQRWNDLCESYREVVRSGRQALWVTEREMRLANEGKLAQRLADRARWNPVLKKMKRLRKRWAR